MGINDSMDSEENERCKPIRYDSDVEGTEKYFETYFQQENENAESSKVSGCLLSHDKLNKDSQNNDQRKYYSKSEANHLNFNSKKNKELEICKKVAVGKILGIID